MGSCKKLVTVQGVSELLQKLPDGRVEIVSCLTLF